MYYQNPDATTPPNADNAFDIGATDASPVCPFNGSTTCAASEISSTSTGVIRYSGSKSAISLDAMIGDYITVGIDSSLDNLHDNAFTAEGWFKPSTSSRYDGGVFLARP